MKLFFLLLLCLALSACQVEVGPPIPLSTPELWQVQITPTMRWLKASFQQCAAREPGGIVVLTERPASALQMEGPDFVFRWGQPKALPAFSVQLGQDELAVVVSANSLVSAIRYEDLAQIYLGKIERWEQLKPPPVASGPIKVFAYPAGEDVTEVTGGWLAPGKAAILAPDAEAVRQAIAADLSAIGVLPARWMDASVKRVKVEGDQPPPSAPLLAMTSTEPVGKKQAWLLCLQSLLR